MLYQTGHCVSIFGSPQMALVMKCRNTFACPWNLRYGVVNDRDRFIQKFVYFLIPEALSVCFVKV